MSNTYAEVWEFHKNGRTKNHRFFKNCEICGAVFETRDKLACSCSRSCGTKKQAKILGPEGRSAVARKRNENMGPEGCSARSIKANETMGPEGRKARKRKQDETLGPERRSNIAKKRDEKLGPEGRSARTVKGNETLGFQGRSTRSLKGRETIGPERRSNIAKKRDEKLGPEGRSARVKKGQETLGIEGRSALADVRHETMKKNGTYGKSKGEDSLFAFLCEKFGEGNIERQVRINGWNVDFYVKSIDTYVQYDGIYYHGLDVEFDILVKRAVFDARNYRGQSQNNVILNTFLRDLEQNDWFLMNDKKLIRVEERQPFETYFSTLKTEPTYIQ